MSGTNNYLCWTPLPKGERRTARAEAINLLASHSMSKYAPLSYRTLCIAKTLGTSLENHRARDLLPSSTAVTGKNTNIGTCTTCLAGGTVEVFRTPIAETKSRFLRL